MLSKITKLDDFQRGQNLYIYPPGNAGRKLYEIIKKERPDINITAFLDSYKNGEMYGVPVLNVSYLSAAADICVVVVMEREQIRKQILGNLHDKGVVNVKYIENDFDYGFVDKDLLIKNDILYFFYDLQVNALNYEFTCSLYHAEIERRKRGCKIVYPVIVPANKVSLFDLSRTAIPEAINDVEQSNYWFMNNVLIPSSAMFPSVGSAIVLSYRKEVEYMFGDNVMQKFPNNYSVSRPIELKSCRYINQIERAHKEYSLPVINDPSSVNFVQQWLAREDIQGEKIIVITLRETSYQCGRNSVISVWKCFADNMIDRGYVPVFVRDTFSDFKDEELQDYIVFHEASWNIFLRSAIYELSYLNMMVNTGPHVFCTYNEKVKFLLFTYISVEDPVGSKDYFEVGKRHIGHQLGIHARFQRTVWGGTDSCELILEEALTMCKEIEENK